MSPLPISELPPLARMARAEKEQIMEYATKHGFKIDMDLKPYP
jgi:hypothetical protein